MNPINNSKTLVATAILCGLGFVGLGAPKALEFVNTRSEVETTANMKRAEALANTATAEAEAAKEKAKRATTAAADAKGRADRAKEELDALKSVEEKFKTAAREAMARSALKRARLADPIEAKIQKELADMKDSAYWALESAEIRFHRTWRSKDAPGYDDALDAFQKRQKTRREGFEGERRDRERELRTDAKSSPVNDDTKLD